MITIEADRYSLHSKHRYESYNEANGRIDVIHGTGTGE